MEGGSNVDGDESGGTSPSRQGAGTGILVPRSLMAMAAEIGIASGEKGSGIRVSATRCKYMPKGGIRGGQGCPGAPPARPGGGPRGQAAWSPCGSPPALLWPHGSFWNADFLYNFSGIFLAVLDMGKPEIQKQQKTKTGTGVH